MSAVVTVAIPVRDGAAILDQTLAAVRRQRLDPGVALELLVCDSGSRDGSAAIARRHGATVFAIAPHEFSHGGTRNLMMKRAQGDHVAFLTQDAVPADADWLTRLTAAFSLAPEVGLAFGPYRPRADASLMVRRELAEWFASLSPDSTPRVDRLGVAERAAPSRALLGARGYFSDANGCVSREAWREVPFRDVAYAEDHVLAHDMLRAGFAKAFVPDAVVVHSHDYSPLEWLRRSFDEARAVDEIYGFSEPGEWRRAVLNVWGRVGADVRFARSIDGPSPLGVIAHSLPHHLARAAGTMLGVRANKLPDAAVERLSLERRR